MSPTLDQARTSIEPSCDQPLEAVLLNRCAKYINFGSISLGTGRVNDESNRREAIHAQIKRDDSHYSLLQAVRIFVPTSCIEGLLDIASRPSQRVCKPVKSMNGWQRRTSREYSSKLLTLCGLTATNQ